MSHDLTILVKNVSGRKLNDGYLVFSNDIKILNKRQRRFLKIMKLLFGGD